MSNRNIQKETCFVGFAAAGLCVDCRGVRSPSPEQEIHMTGASCRLDTKPKYKVSNRSMRATNTRYVWPKQLSQLRYPPAD
jgi:hypothetical protein